jgi:RHH-type proline utilization regulon transcriptional repressor/proline dehydrogenase/delta 1-pyrroline-5-carboxylate dehydrogenase
VDEVQRSVDGAIRLAGQWLTAADEAETSTERRQREQFQDLIGSPEGVAFTRVFVDRVMRVDDDVLAAEIFHDLVTEHGHPAFLPATDRLLVAAGARVAPRLPSVAMPLARRRVRQMLSSLIGPAEPEPLRRVLRDLHDANFRANVNLLGEAVLGEQEARNRLAKVIALVRRPEIEYVSVKVSAIASQLHPWAFDANLDRIEERLEELWRAASDRRDPVFVNLDMEEYRDLDLTVAAFTRVLEKDEFAGLDAGIVLQAYLPDSLGMLRHLLEWANERHAATGAVTKIRFVKGANLAMERLEGALHGHTPAPYPDKAAVDANYKRLVDVAFQPEQLVGARIGIASHNLFDLAFAHLLAEERGVSDEVTFEMLSGMATAQANVIVRHRPVRLYLPVVGADDFDAAVAYLFRRLEENTQPGNFLTESFSIAAGSATFEAQAEQFRTAVATRHDQPSGSRRWTGGVGHPSHPHVPPRETEGVAAEYTPLPDTIALGGSEVDAPGFVNWPEADPTDPAVRRAMAAAVATGPSVDVPPPPGIEEVDHAIERLRASDWPRRDPRHRADVLEAVAHALDARRADLVGVMAHDAAKTIAQGDPEVSEAADFATYYAGCARRLEDIDGARFEPYGTVVVAPPWNFPLAIPVGGVMAALAAGATVAFKPAPETRMVAAAAHQVMLAAGVPDDAVVFLPTDDDEAGQRLITHPDVDAVILTGATETAELFRSWRPDLRLHAETSGKNALVVTPNADMDLAVADLVDSAFGHAGQKCSAASLGILVGTVGDHERFRRQLVDATRSLTVGPATDLETDMTPTTPPPSDKLLRGLTTLEPGESWLLEPEQLDEGGHTWSPGIRDHVQPGSWFHMTECFGPVLGLIRVDTLAEAIAVQNQVAYGLTGGIHSLDEDEVATWLDAVEVGNAYVNRVITGAIVRRQPFGGWKASVVGPGAKAGGPNMVPSLGTWHDDGDPTNLADPSAAVRGLLARAADLFDGARLDAIGKAAGSDAWWWQREFGIAHDPTRLSFQANVMRYRALPRWFVRAAADARPGQVVRCVVAAVTAGTPVTVSTPDEDLAEAVTHVAGDQRGVVVVVEERPLVGPGIQRVQVVGSLEDTIAGLPVDIHVEDRPVVGSGRVMLPRVLREQSVSHDVHRFGHVAD